MIIINMDQFRQGRSEAEAQDAVRRLFFPFTQPAEDDGPHTHSYAIVLAVPETGDGYELGAFEAPCPVDDAPANIRAVVTALRDAAAEVESAYADTLDLDVPANVLVDMLGLAQVSVTEAEVKVWTLAQRRQAEHWATATHLAASDNDVIVPDQPDFLAQGDFRLGDVVRNRQNGTEMIVTGGGIWLASFYELVRPAPCSDLTGYHAADCDCGMDEGD